MAGRKLERSFYLQEDVVSVARQLIGKYLVVKTPKGIRSGMISETEAYAGITDKASHAYKGRRTQRTEIMYHIGGTAYIYLCYGIHHLFNVVTNVEGIPHAVLIRALIPADGAEQMIENSGSTKNSHNLCKGPGKLCRAMGIVTDMSGADLCGGDIWLEDRGTPINASDILCTKRIGIDYAKEDAALPYRFVLR